VESDKNIGSTVKTFDPTRFTTFYNFKLCFQDFFVTWKRLNLSARQQLLVTNKQKTDANVK